MTEAREPVGYDQAVASWSRHLRGGGTTAWRDWTASSESRLPLGPAASWDEALPGAAQLELVRRLAQRLEQGLAQRRDGGAAATGGGFADLADLALARSGPGRGLGQQPLVWDGPGEPRRFGPPPVDPADVPAEELVRVGVGVLGELLLLPTEAGPVAVRAPARRPWSSTPAFVLDGSPVTTAAVRRGLAVAGHVEGGRAPLVVLLAEPLDVALSQVWSTRVQAGAPVRWRGFLERCSRGAALPLSVDVPALARQCAERVGPGAVHVVVAAQDTAAATRTVAKVLGVGLGERHPGLVPGWADLAPEAVDAVRRVNAVLGVRAGGERSGPARRRLVSGLAADQVPPGEPLTVPPRFRGWVRRRAATLVEGVATDDYAVHGNLGALVPRPGGRPSHPRLEGTLEVVLDACLRQAVLAGLDPMRAKEH